MDASKFRIKSYPLLASSHHVGATEAVTISFIMFVERKIEGQFSASRLVKTIINWDCFSNCFESGSFVSDCFFVHVHTFLDCFVLDCFVWDCFVQTRNFQFS